MNACSKRFACALAAVSVIATARPASAQLTLNKSSSTASAYTFGDLGLAFSNCQVGTSSSSASACSGSTKVEVLGISSGRGGTTLEIESTAPSSAIFSSSQSNYYLSFDLVVTPQTGSRGISKIQETLNGSSSSSGHNGDLSSTISTSSGIKFSTAIANLATSATSSSSSLVNVGVPQTFNISLNVANPNKNGLTLTLSNVALLFTPAPEPASIALLATGLVGLGAARRRLQRGKAREAAAAHCEDAD